MANRFDICSPRKRNDGKTFWLKIGTAWQNDKGIQLVFDALPIPDAEGRCVASLFEPREQGQRQQSQQQSADSNRWGGDEEPPF